MTPVLPKEIAMKTVILAGALTTFLVSSSSAFACWMSSNPAQCYAVDCDAKPNFFERAMCKIGILGQPAPHG
jgi:hypothetical protein